MFSLVLEMVSLACPRRPYLCDGIAGPDRSASLVSLALAWPSLVSLVFAKNSDGIADNSDGIAGYSDGISVACLRRPYLCDGIAGPDRSASLVSLAFTGNSDGITDNSDGIAGHSDGIAGFARLASLVSLALTGHTSATESLVLLARPRCCRLPSLSFAGLRRQ